MGRSVSVPRNAVATAYIAWWNSYEDEESDYLNSPEPGDWNDFAAKTQEKIVSVVPGLVPLDTIQGEYRAIAGNDWVTVVLSDYMDIAAVSLVPVPQLDARMDVERDAWITGMLPRFHEQIGTHVKIGTFSNGESVYESKTSPELILDYSQRM